MIFNTSLKTELGKYYDTIWYYYDTTIYDNIYLI